MLWLRWCFCVASLWTLCSICTLAMPLRHECVCVFDTQYWYRQWYTRPSRRPAEWAAQYTHTFNVKWLYSLHTYPSTSRIAANATTTAVAPTTNRLPLRPCYVVAPSTWGESIFPNIIISLHMTVCRVCVDGHKRPPHTNTHTHTQDAYK